jgi:hypothetical protein
MLFVSIDLLETLIPSSICFVDTNLLTSLQVLHIHFLHSSIFFFCLYQMCSVLVTYAFTISTLRSLLFISPDQLNTHSYFRQIFLTLTSSYFMIFSLHSLILLSLGSSRCSSLSTFERSISWIFTYFITLSLLNNIPYFLILYSHMKYYISSLHPHPISCNPLLL